jgi:hypothetical protein
VVVGGLDQHVSGYREAGVEHGVYSLWRLGSLLLCERAGAEGSDRREGL